MEIQVCFVEGTRGGWLDYEPSTPLPASDHPDEIAGVVNTIRLPEGVTAMRVLTAKEVWSFHYHPTYGSVPKLRMDAGEVTMDWPTNKDVGGVWTVNRVLPDGNLLPLCYVEGAVGFTMGDDESKSRRKVNVDPGFMALTPTTVRQWNWYAAATGMSPKSTSVTDKSGATVDLNDHPVVEVSYWDACEFAKWAGVGLPTEEEWEHAARGNDGRKFPWGNEAPSKETCHSSIQTQQERTDNVFKRPKGASPYGLLDMSGNVWEWTSTIHK